MFTKSPACISYRIHLVPKGVEKYFPLRPLEEIDLCSYCHMTKTAMNLAIVQLPFRDLNQQFLCLLCAWQKKLPPMA